MSVGAGFNFGCASAEFVPTRGDRVRLCSPNKHGDPFELQSALKMRKLRPGKFRKGFIFETMQLDFSDSQLTTFHRCSGVDHGPQPGDLDTKLTVATSRLGGS